MNMEIINEGIYKYKSSNGIKYQYDLNNPSDKLAYEIDFMAKQRDKISVNPNRNLDVNLSQIGGGIEK